MNNRGFTMIELLGAITILAIMLAFAIPNVYKHVIDTKSKAYVTLQKTCFEAAHSKAVNEGADPSSGNITYNISDLASGGYMDKPMDPYKDGTECTGNVVISTNSNSTDTKLASYKYTVNLTCSKGTITKVYNTED